MSRIVGPRRLGLVCAGVLAAGAWFVASSVGEPSHGPSKPGLDAGGSVAHTSAARPAASARFIYVYELGHVPGKKFKMFIARCPSAYPHPIGGVFDSSSVRVFLSTDRPSPDEKPIGSAKGWAIGVANFGQSSADVTAGAVCAQ